MKTATVREIRNSFPAVLKLISNGESVSITLRRKVVATLSPPVIKKKPRPHRPWGDIDAHFAKIQKMPMSPISGADMLAEDRDRY